MSAVRQSDAVLKRLRGLVLTLSDFVSLSAGFLDGRAGMR